MQMIINNSKWRIEEVEVNSPKLAYGDSIGVCDNFNNVIFLNKDLGKERKEKVLIHELTHAFITEYASKNRDTWNEEEMCNFVASHLASITKIVIDYAMKTIESEEEND